MTEPVLNMEKIYTDYYEKVSRYVSGKIQAPHDVEELVSEVFLKLCSKADTFDSAKASVSTWIYTITQNTVIDYFRKKKPLLLLEEELYQLDDESDRSFGENELDLLADALCRLDERARDLIILHYYSGYTLKTIAEMMKMSYANIKIVHKKALNHLEKYMTE